MKPLSASKTSPPNRPPGAAARATAGVSIEARMRPPALQEHVITLNIDLGGPEPKHQDKVRVMALTREAFAMFAPVDGARDLRRFSDVFQRPGGPVTGVDASVVQDARPTVAAIDALRAILIAEGYRVTVREARPCGHPGCGAEAVVDWNRPTLVPPGWFNHATCGKHQYRTCTACRSTYLMTSENTAGQAPSVRCEVCGAMMIEWGGTKLWHAELVSRGGGRDRA
jgi:hypothetical protein